MWILKTRLIWGLVAGATTLVVVVVGVVVILVGGLAGTEQSQQGDSAAGCAGSTVVNAGDTHGAGPDGELPQGSASGFDAQQVADAKTIIAVGKGAGVPAYGWVIAIATALQESGLHNLTYGDRDSVGLFQQRPSAGWGTPAQIETPALSAAAFFGVATHTHNTGLLQIAGWRKMQVTAAAQAVQRSAFPLAYAQHAARAQALVSALAKGVSAADLTATATDVSCTIGLAGMDTQVVRPVAASTDLNNYGGSGSHWASIHTGDDLSAACGTPVQAATSGTIVIRSGGGWAWAGNWLVQVQTAPGALTTWYGHMRKLDVIPGQQVKAGQVIGEVGDLGNATGCHLHFEVHPHGGGYLQDQVDPHVWLQKNLGQTLKATAQAAALPGAPGVTPAAPAAPAAGGPGVRIVQANIKVSLSAAKFRADLTKVVSYGPDFVSINEAMSRSDDQVTPTGYGSYRASAQEYGKRSQALGPTVLWRSDRWVAVAHGTLQLTKKAATGVRNDDRYANWVTLSSSDGSGRVSVISTHAMTEPASSGRSRQAEDQRGFAALAGLAKALQTYGPVLVAGDLNSPYPRTGGAGEWWGPKPLMDRVGMTSTFAALGAPPQGWPTHDGGGTIDWIFGSSATIRPTSQATFPMNSDHRGVIADFSLTSQ